MSHYSVLIIGEDPESLLAPYSEHLVVEHSISREELIEKEKASLDYYKAINAEYQRDPTAYIEKNKMNKEHISFVKGELQDMLNKWTDDDWYKKAIRYYDEEDINEDGSVNSDYNLMSKWDWYQLGGRWSDRLKLKKGHTSSIRGERSWTLDKTPPLRGFSDSALKGEIDWEHESMKDFCTFAFLGSNGEWAEEGKVGWFGSMITEDENWKSTFQKLLDSVGDDERISLYDCHI